jgi:hypothetical protein
VVAEHGATVGEELLIVTRHQTLKHRLEPRRQCAVSDPKLEWVSIEAR